MGLYIYQLEYERFLRKKIMKGKNLKEIEDMDIIKMKFFIFYTIPS
jgi:hypothetical protein